MHGLLWVLFSIMSFSAWSMTTVTGPWIEGRRDTYRYVTTYEVTKIKRALTDFPWIEEDCHDQGNRFANWSKSLSYEISYEGRVNFNLLGFVGIEFGGARSRTIEITFQRWVTPTLGIRARHILHEEFEIWNGQTRKEYQVGERIEISENVTDFRLNKINYGVSVEREVLEVCEL